jgi:hypothetical protein
MRSFLVFSITRGRSVRIVRILVAVKPRVYREVVALLLHQQRPDAEVLIPPPESFDGEVGRFKLHLVVCTEGAVPNIPPGVLCRVEIMFSDGLDARIGLDGQVTEAKHVGTEPLLALVDQAAEMISEEKNVG